MTSWKKYTIGELVDLSQGQVINAQTNHLVVKKGLPLLRITDMINNKQVVFIDAEKVPVKNIAKSDDIIYTRTGQVGLVFTNQYGVVHNNCFKVIPKDKSLDRKFLFWLLRSNAIYKFVNGVASGSAQPDLPHSSFKSIKLSLPPLSIQQKIVTILSTYDELIENNKQRIKLLEEMAEEIYKEWFVRLRFPGYESCSMIDGLTEGWIISPLKEHIKINRGKSYSSEDLRDDEGLPMLNLKNIQRGGGFRRDGLKYFEGKYSETNIAYSGDIVMAVTDMTQNRELVGRVARVPAMNIPKFIFSMDLVKIDPVKLPINFLYSFFKYSGIGLKLAEFANGANVLHLTPNLINYEIVTLPSFELALRFDELITPIFNEIDILENKIDILQQTRDLLLPRLISGKLSVEHLIDESENLSIAAEQTIAYETSK
ncbi:MAG: restriction endonuclease subunit S [Ferruginibacter sp.]